MTTRAIRAAFIHPPSTAEQRRRIHLALSGHLLAIARNEDAVRRARLRRMMAETLDRVARREYMEGTLAGRDMEPYIAALVLAARSLRRAGFVERARERHLINDLAAFRLYCQGVRT